MPKFTIYVEQKFDRIFEVEADTPDKAVAIMRQALNGDYGEGDPWDYQANCYSAITDRITGAGAWGPTEDPYEVYDSSDI